jgi:hypothetical protein
MLASVVRRAGSLSWIAAFGILLLAAVGVQAQSGVFTAEPLGTASASQAITVTATTAGTVSSAEVLTGGQSGLDFTVGTGASTCTGANLGVNGQCTEYVTFNPTAPGMRMGAVVLIGTVGGSPAVLGTAYLSGTGTGPLGAFIPGNWADFAGTGTYLGSVGDGKPATVGELYLPSGVAVDGGGNLYIADSLHNRVRMVCASTTSPAIAGVTCPGAKIILTVVGSGVSGSPGNGPAATATLDDPGDVAVDGAGNVFIADTGNNVVREVVAATGQIVTVAGGAATVCGAASDTVGDGCSPLQATLNQPEGVTIDVQGNIFIADTANQRIREVSLSTGLITNVAGTGYTVSDGSGAYNGDNITAITAELNNPYAVAFDAAGNMYIPDSGNSRVRLVKAVGGNITPASMITTSAGTGGEGFAGDGGLATAAEVWAPSGAAVDPAGNVYISDRQNKAIRKVSVTTGDISTLVRNGIGHYTSNDAFGTVTLSGPIGLALDTSGNLYVTDSLNMVVRQLQSNYVGLDYTTAVRQGSLSTPMPVTIENIGNSDLDLTTITPDANSQLDGATTTCMAGPPDLPPAGDCVIGAVFAPTTAADPLVSNINLTSPTVNSPLDILLVGDAEPVNSTATTVTSAPNPSAYGQSVAFTVTVTTGAGTGNLTGTVSLADTYNGTTTTLAPTLAVSASGVAMFSTTALGVGSHTIVASYKGDTAHYSSTSIDNGVSPLIQMVNEATKTTLISSERPSQVGQSVTFTATVAISGGGGVTPDGTVTFYDGATVLQTVALTGSTAAYSTTALTVGMHSITAEYSGDASIDVLPSTSAVLSQDVQAQATITLGSSPNPSNYGSPVAFTATIASGSTTAATGTVKFFDGATNIGSGTLSGNPGVATYTTSTLSVATHPITATYVGDANNSSGTSNVVNQVVNQTQTTTTMTATPVPGVANKAEAITAVVKVTAGAGAGTPTGTVTFTSGTTTLGTATLSAAGTATINPVLASGTYQIVATYSGDTDNGSSVSAAFSLTVETAVTTTTLVVSPTQAQVGAPVTFTATVASNGTTPTGTVIFLSGTTTLGTATVTAGAATLTTSGIPVGTYSVTASYGGDTDNAASVSGAVNLAIGLIPTTTGLATSSNGNNQTVLIAVVIGANGSIPTGTVTFTSNGNTIGSGTLDTSGVVTITPDLSSTGNYTIVAAYSGDTTHASSASQPVTISGSPAGFSISVTPTKVSLQASQNVSLTLSLTSIGGFTDTVGLGCASLPAGVTCNFSTPSMTLGANATAIAQLTIDTNSPLGGGASAMNNGPHGKSAVSMAGLFFPLSVLFGFIFWRQRRRSGAMLTMVLVMALSAAALMATGCSGYSSSKAAPGTYTIQVTGTGANSNVIHYQNVTLDITN